MREPVRDEARREVAARGLTQTAVAHLTRDALGTIDLAALAPVKQLLKRFFSNEPWTDDDDDALAMAVGDGGEGDQAGGGRAELEPGLTLEWGWDDGPFRLRVESSATAPDDASSQNSAAATDLG